MTIHAVLSDGFALSISQSCQALEVSRSGYYKWRTQPEIAPADSEDLDLKNRIREIAMEFAGYGYRRMTAELQNRGFEVNRKRILRLMRQDNLLCKKKRFKPVTTDSSHGLPVYPNLLKGAKITGLNQVWASDITYVQLLHEHIYLAVVLDLYSRKCIGWELSRSIRSDLAMSALAKALKNRTTESLEGLIHHSDQGVQYASKDYVDCLPACRCDRTRRQSGDPPHAAPDAGHERLPRAELLRAHGGRRPAEPGRVPGVGRADRAAARGTRRRGDQEQHSEARLQGIGGEITERGGLRFTPFLLPLLYGN